MNSDAPSNQPLAWVALALVAAAGTYFGAVWLLESREPKTVTVAAPPRPHYESPPFAPEVQQPAQPARDRIYRDSKGKLVSEREAEENMRMVRAKITAMPESNKKAYLQGVMKALEEEWERMKSEGPVN